MLPSLSLVPVLTDPAALDLVARKDDRKRVRRLVAQNPHTSRDTLLFLLGWSVRPRVSDDELLELLFNRSELSWDDLFPVVSTTKPFPPVSWYQLALVVRRAGTVEAYRSALGLQITAFSEVLLRDVFDGSVEGISYTEALSLAAPSGEVRQHLLSGVLTARGAALPLEVARLVAAELPVWRHFPVHLFKHARASRPLLPEVVEVYVAANEHRANLMLAASAGVPEDVLLRLVGDQELRSVLAGRGDLPYSVLEVIVNDPVQKEIRDGRTVHRCAAVQLVGQSLPEDLASRLTDRLAAGEFRGGAMSVLTLLKQASSGSRLGYLRRPGSWSVTKPLLMGGAGPVLEGEVRALFADPGVAFARHVPGASYGAPSTFVAASSREEIGQLFFEELSYFLDKPWTFELLDELPGLLASVPSPNLLSGYLWERLAPVRESRHLLEAFLSLAPEWTGTVPELVDVVLLTA